MASSASPAPHEPGIVVIGASAGGIGALTTILSALPSDFPDPIVIVQHRAASGPSYLVEVLARTTRLTVVEAKGGDTLRPKTVYLARADQHLTVTPAGCFVYIDGDRIHHVLSSANPLFTSSAECFGVDAIAIVLSGSGHDGTDGVQAIKAHGGTVIVQDEATSQHFGMPRSAIESGAVDMVLPIEAIGPALVRLVITGPRHTATIDDEGTRT